MAARNKPDPANSAMPRWVCDVCPKEEGGLVFVKENTRCDLLKEYVKPFMCKESVHLISYLL